MESHEFEVEKVMEFWMSESVRTLYKKSTQNQDL